MCTCYMQIYVVKHIVCLMCSRHNLMFKFELIELVTK